MRILNDKLNQRYNAESDVAVMEASEESPGDAKFIFDRYRHYVKAKKKLVGLYTIFNWVGHFFRNMAPPIKSRINTNDLLFSFNIVKLSIENKTIVDRYLLDGVMIKSMDSLQISGLEAFIVNTSLEEPGLYVTTELGNYKVDNTIKNLKKYMNLAIDLLCFREECVSVSNRYDEHLITEKSKKKSNKRPANSIIDDELSMKQESIRGTWFPPRTSQSLPPNVPENPCK